MRLKEKVALVTGASRGIGEAIALAFAGEGADIAINCSMSVKAAEVVAKKIDELQIRHFRFILLGKFKKLFWSHLSTSLKNWVANVLFLTYGFVSPFARSNTNAFGQVEH